MPPCSALGATEELRRAGARRKKRTVTARPPNYPTTFMFLAARRGDPVVALLVTHRRRSGVADVLVAVGSAVRRCGMWKVVCVSVLAMGCGGSSFCPDGASEKKSDDGGARWDIGLPPGIR